MANISWTSSSINSFFNTSLGNPTSGFGGLYNSLSDASMIKSGVYHKLMDSYYSTMKNSAETSTDAKTDYTTEKESKITNKVLDELLSKEKKESVVSNKILDELLTSEKTTSTASTYDSTGTKTQNAAATTIDQSI